MAGNLQPKCNPQKFEEYYISVYIGPSIKEGKRKEKR